jgi:hypothetical protein
MKQAETTDAEIIAMTTDEKLERFRQMRSMTEYERTALKIGNINKMLLMVSSAERAEVMLALTRRQRAEVFWPVFFENWSHCDDTWYLRDDLLGQLQRFEDEAPGVEFLSAEARAAYDALPDPVRLFRGCSRKQIMAITWTTDREIAAGFAHGHRFIEVSDPVIASGLVPKRAVYGVCMDRGESDVILDPQYVHDLELEAAPHR